MVCINSRIKFLLNFSVSALLANSAGHLFAQSTLADQPTLAGTWTGTDNFSIQSGGQTGSVSFTCTFIFAFTTAQNTNAPGSPPSFRLNYNVRRSWICTRVSLPAGVSSPIKVGDRFSDEQPAVFNPGSSLFQITLGAFPLFDFPTPTISIPGNSAIGRLSEPTKMSLSASSRTSDVPNQGIRATETVDLVFGDPPNVTRQPSSQVVRVGDAVMFSVSASGVTSYQWSKGDATIEGATRAAYTIPAAQLGDAGTYSVRLTNLNASIVSSVAALTVNPQTSVPAVTRQPASVTAAAGSTVVFGVAAGGQPPPVYQWRVNGQNLPSATGATLVLQNVGVAQAGSYMVIASNSSGSVASVPASLAVIPSSTDPGRLTNLSILTDLTANETMTIGTVLGGAGTAGRKPLLARAVGPSLSTFGVTATLPNPWVTLNNTNASPALLVSNNSGWGGSANLSSAFVAVGAFPYLNAGSSDSAVYEDSLGAGNYAIQVTDANGGAGSVLAELYDATPASTFSSSTPRLINVSVLKSVGNGASLTAGFVISGSTGRTVLIRAIGPALGLAPFNLAGVMPAPQLTLVRTSPGPNATLAANSAWGGDPAIAATATRIGAFPVTNAASTDAMLLMTLSPGNYTTQVNATGTTSGGTVIVEVYEVP
jgi:hypothetical protein